MNCIELEQLASQSRNGKYIEMPGKEKDFILQSKLRHFQMSLGLNLRERIGILKRKFPEDKYCLQILVEEQVLLLEK